MERTQDTARQQYVAYQHQNDHTGLQTTQTGLVVSINNPWLAASPDNKVHDPSASPSLGIAEYKNPYSARDLSLAEACDQIIYFPVG